MSDTARHSGTWINQCFGKEAYATAALARKVADRRNASKRRRLKAPPKPLQHYRCEFCSAWHIGGRI